MLYFPLAKSVARAAIDYYYNFCNIPFYSRTHTNYCSRIVINGRTAAITDSNSGDNLNWM